MLVLPPPLDQWNIQPPLADETFRFQRGVVDEHGTWVPLLTPKGYEVFNDRHRNILLKGCRKSSKTVGAANKFTRHLWENDGAVAGVFARTMKNGLGGAWNDLTNFVLPGWQAADFGFKIVERGVNPSSKMPFVRIKNMHGGTSEVQLHSVNHEPDIESQVMALRFSAIWFSQAEQFMSMDTYRILLMQLRMEMFGIPRSEHFAIFDANPPEDGEDHWLHDLFEKGKIEGSRFFRKDYHDFFSSYQFGLDDNPLLDPADKEELKNTYRADPVKYERMVEGKWVRDAVEGLFDQQFQFNIHVKGSSEGEDKSQWQVITPHRNAEVLLTGTDTGDLNHATTFICPRVDGRDEVCYDVFDEITSIDKAVSVRAFAKDVWARVQFWQKWMMDTYGLKEPPPWRHWADSSLFDFNAGANNNDAQVFWEASGKEIGMRPVVKGKGSIRARIGMARRLFHDNRLLISSHCLWNVSWARYLKPGKANNKPISDGTIKFKHTFDATTYAIGAEVPYELKDDDKPSVATGIHTIGA